MLVDVYNVKTEGYTANVNFVVVHVRTATRSFVPILPVALLRFTVSCCVAHGQC